MSAHSTVGVEIRAIAILIKSIIDLGVEYKKLSKMRTEDGKIHDVELIVKDANGKDIGFEKTDSGDYRIISDSTGLNKAQLKKQADLIKQIKQRYSYNTVIDKLKKDGYIIAQEEKVNNNTIRLVARKWG